MLKRCSARLSLLLLVVVIFFALGHLADTSAALQEAAAFKVGLETTEGCECVAPCPCYSIEPASFSRCRALKFYEVQSGTVDGLNLKGFVFVAAIADAPKKMYELRDWHGAMYMPEKANEAQRKALRRVADNIWNGVYRDFEPRVAAITYVRHGDAREGTIGTVGHLLTAPLYGPDGKVKGFPKDPNSKSGVSVRNHFDDGKVKWDLAGRSSRVGAMAVVFAKPTK